MVMSMSANLKLDFNKVKVLTFQEKEVGHILVNGWTVKCKVLVIVCGRMELPIRANGETTAKRGKAPLIIQTVLFSLEIS